MRQGASLRAEQSEPDIRFSNGRLRTSFVILRGAPRARPPERTVERLPPRTTSDEIDLYMRTYMSLLRSSGEVRVRAFEEAHVFSNSSLHAGARESAFDAAAFGYSAARLPACMHAVQRVVLGQSYEQFESEGMPVREWSRVRTRGRRRPLRYDDHNTLAVFVASISDIDDLVPICTAYQLEWNKMSRLFRDVKDVYTAFMALPEGEQPTPELETRIEGLQGRDRHRRRCREAGAASHRRRRPGRLGSARAQQ